MSSFISNTLTADGPISKKLLQPIVNFAARFYVAFIFFQAGLQKIDSNYKVTAETIGTFRDEYKIPFIPPEIAANIACYAELSLSVLLVLGLFARPAALALFILNAVALYSLHIAGWDNAVANWKHIFWGALMLGIFAYGPSKISIDDWISAKSKGLNSNLFLKIIGIILFSGIFYVFLNKAL